eukprot:Skav202956  [mRNA]  locus=scaffold2274:78405:98726:+ [translate_table: standard]
MRWYLEPFCNDRSETCSFLSTGIYDGPWSSKFTASKSPGALNRWKSDQRPDPAWYKVQYNMVIGRTKGPDFRERALRQSSDPPGPLALCDAPTSPKNVPQNGPWPQQGYPKQRFPAWDFTKSLGRKPLLENDVAAPGKYDPNYSAVRGKVPSGVGYERQLPRDSADGLLGHFAPQAVLHPDAKRFPGGVRFDTSTAKARETRGAAKK